jgi:hypothetical protein
MKATILTFLLMSIAAVGFAQAPTTNADDPEARDAENVISIYGDTYETISDVNYDPNWGQSGHQQVDPAFDPGTGNPVLAYPNFNYQGTEFPVQNAAEMQFLHVDIWVAEGTNRMVKVTPVQQDASEFLVEVPVTPGSWNSVSLPVDAFEGMNWQNVYQLKFDGQFNADGSANTDPFDIYVDNIFFWKNASTAANDATLNDLKIDGETIEGFDPGVQEYTVNLVAGTTEIPEITEATPTNENASVTITQATEIPGDATVDVVSESGENERTYTVSFVANIPGVGAPEQPVRNPEDVISIFSDAYTDITVDTFSAPFDDSDVQEVTIDGNPALQIDFNNFLAIDFQSNRQDASEMTHFHMNFWTGNDVQDKSFNLKFSEWGGTDGEVSAFEYSITGASTPPLESGTWVTVDVPLDNWSGDVTRSDIAQFLMTSNLDVVFIDNLYLYREGEVNEPDIDAFSLLSPADGTTLTVSGDPSQEVVVSWEVAESEGDVRYTWHADLPDSDFSDPLVSLQSDNNGIDPTLTVTYGEIASILEDLGFSEGETAVLDWTVTAQAGSTVRFAEEPFGLDIELDALTSSEPIDSPHSFELKQNYPNPFNPSTTISYSIPENAEVTLEVFNAVGQKVETLVSGVQNAGSHSVSFNASNLSSGVYLYKLTSGDRVQVNKMLLVK